MTADTGTDAAKEAASCGSTEVETERHTITTEVPVPGNVVIVFDSSDSMNDAWALAGGGSQPKYVAANQAVTAALMPIQDKLNVGAVFFPSSDVGDFLCPDVAPIANPPQIPIQSGAMFLQAWSQHWSPQPAQLFLGTPLEKGLTAGAAALSTPPAGITVLLLVTDGAPTCGMNEPAIAAQLLTRGIKTYVIGLPGIIGAPVLDQVALSGGTAPAGCTTGCYFAPSDSSALQQKLADIATTAVTTKTVVSLASCTFDLTPPDGGDKTQVHLVVTDAMTMQKYEVLRTPGGPDGWELAPDATSATLIGDTCVRAKAGEFSGFQFSYGCVMVPPLPTH